MKVRFQFLFKQVLQQNTLQQPGMLLVEPGLRAARVAHQLLRLEPKGDLFSGAGHGVAAMDQVPETNTHTHRDTHSELHL